MSVLPSYKGYQAKVEYSVEDGLVIGEVIGVRDSLNFHADTVDPKEIEAMFHQCIDDYLAFCAELGVDPDKSYSGTFNVRVGAELHRLAEQEAVKRGIPLNKLVSQAIENEVKGYHAASYTMVLPTQKVNDYQAGEIGSDSEKTAMVQSYLQAKRSLKI